MLDRLAFRPHALLGKDPFPVADLDQIEPSLCGGRIDEARLQEPVLVGVV